MTFRIANGAGFLGDQLDTPRLLVESAVVDVLTLEYLAELTMSILAYGRRKDPATGYARDFVDVTRSLVPALKDQSQLRIVTNAGGVNPIACVQAVARILCECGLEQESLAVVTGDDLLDRLDELQRAGCLFENDETGEPLSELDRPIVCANAYLGSSSIAASLDSAARIVITGRVADASLAVGPAVHAFGWKWDQWDKLAAASVAGHLIECGAQVTGGYSTRWHDSDLANVGYPIAELDESGNAIITKPVASGGGVTRHSVVEQLVYEIADPSRYITPDVVVDFTTVQVDQREPDRVQVRGARGFPAPDKFKVSLAYHDGFTASSQLVVFGDDCLKKAHDCARIVRQRIERAGVSVAKFHEEYLGTGDSLPGVSVDRTDQPAEIVLRMSVRDRQRESVQRFVKEIAPLITSGPAGLAGYAVGRSPVRPVFAYWPTSVPKQFVTDQFRVQTATQWSA